jgi:hypothetical protein
VSYLAVVFQTAGFHKKSPKIPDLWRLLWAFLAPRRAIARFSGALMLALPSICRAPSTAVGQHNSRKFHPNTYEGLPNASIYFHGATALRHPANCAGRGHTGLAMPRQPTRAHQAPNPAQQLNLSGNSVIKHMGDCLMFSLSERAAG